MARETRAVWARRIAQWQRSGLTAERFAGREGINPRTLTFWKWKLGRLALDRPASDGPPEPRRAGAVGFVEVLRAAATPASPAPMFEVVLPDGYRIGVREMMAKLVEIIRQFTPEERLPEAARALRMLTPDAAPAGNSAE